ncbi:hypothetical protein B0H19DRAFT_1085935 [Mycena capillaripes]|nr:hypothetical protein B0H19DRAFT_1085935 [Mycena capillaripes]
MPVTGTAVVSTGVQRERPVTQRQYTKLAIFIGKYGVLYLLTYLLVLEIILIWVKTRRSRPKQSCCSRVDLCSAALGVEEALTQSRRRDAKSLASPARHIVEGNGLEREINEEYPPQSRRREAKSTSNPARHIVEGKPDRRKVHSDLDAKSTGSPNSNKQRVSYSAILLSSTHFDHTQSSSSTTMPYSPQPSPSELRRRRALAAITRIRDPIEQVLAHLDKRLYKDFLGMLYTVYRVKRVFDDELRIWVDALDVKAGFATDLPSCQCNYRDNCRDVEFIWMSSGATIEPYPCPGCGVKHREFFLDFEAGGIEGVCEIIELWLEILGQPVEKVGIDPIN